MVRRAAPLSSRSSAATLAALIAACGASQSAAPPPSQGADAQPQPIAQPESRSQSQSQTQTQTQPQTQTQAPFGAIALTGDLSRLRKQEPVEFLLHTSRPERLLERYAAIHPEARRSEQGVIMGAGALPATLEARHRAASFLVDFDQPAIAELSAQLGAEAGLDALRDRVAHQFATITYGTFWTASRAAKLQTGDCTEHAVLLAALARARGLPARVVLGYVMLSNGERGLALGHAWTEVHDGTRWQRLDATPIGGEHVAYLVIGELIDEGPGFGLSLLDSMEILRVDSIEIVAPSR